MINLFFLTLIVKLLMTPLVTGNNEGLYSINEVILFFPDIIFIIICLYIYFKETDQKKNYLSRLIIFLVIIVIISNLINNISLIGSLQNLVRTLLPITLIYFLSFQKNKINREKLLILGISLVIVITLLNFYAFINFSPEYNRGSKFLPSYFNGTHISSYLLLSTYFLALINYETSQKSFQFRIFIKIYTIFCIYMFMFGWGVRTILISFLLFHILYYLSIKNISNPFSNFLKIFITLLVLIVILLQTNIISFDNIDLVSSGRISMYYEKFSLIRNFSIIEVLLGKGFGSDLIFTDVWWWDTKGSHNDFITIFFENGILFTVIFLITLSKLYKLLKDDLPKIIFLTIITTSLFSNGFIVRPMSMYVMVLVFLIYNNYNTIKENA